MKKLTLLLVAAGVLLGQTVPAATADDGTKAPSVNSQAATGISDTAATLQGTVNPWGATVEVSFQYGTTNRYGATTPPTQVVSSGSVLVQSRLTGLLPATTYHYRIVVTKPGTTNSWQGGDRSFKTAVLGSVSPGTDPAPVGPSPDGDDPTAAVPDDSTPASAPTVAPVPPSLADPSDPGAGDADSGPQLGSSVVAGVSAGAVRVKAPGADGFATLVGDAPVPVGSVVDARKGRVQLVTAVGSSATQSGTFHGSVFQVRQPRAEGGMTELVLRGGDFAACRRPGSSALASAAGAKRRPRVVRRLWGTDHHGRFRTRGSNSIGTVRGTSWVTTDRCDGTTTRVTHGSVSVRDLTTGRTVLVRAGHSYLARAAR